MGVWIIMNNILLLYSVKENKKENTDEVIIEILEKEMQKGVSVNDIDRSNRLGEKTGSRPWLIIIKLARYNI